MSWSIMFVQALWINYLIYLLTPSLPITGLCRCIKSLIHKWHFPIIFLSDNNGFAVPLKNCSLTQTVPSAPGKQRITIWRQLLSRRLVGILTIYLCSSPWQTNEYSTLLWTQAEARILHARSTVKVEVLLIIINIISVILLHGKRIKRLISSSVDSESDNE